MKKLFSILVLCFLVASELVAQNEKFKEDDDIEIVTTNDPAEAPHLRRHHILLDGAYGLLSFGNGGPISISVGSALGYQYRFIPWLSAQVGVVIRGVAIVMPQDVFPRADGAVGSGFYLGGTFTTSGEYMFEAFLQTEFLFDCSSFIVTPRLGIGYRSLPIGGIFVFRMGVAANLWVIGEITTVATDAYIGFGFAF